jgi:hypothetical protein
VVAGGLFGFGLFGLKVYVCVPLRQSSRLSGVYTVLCFMKDFIHKKKKKKKEKKRTVYL